MLECRCSFVTRDDRRYRVQAPPKGTLAVDAQQNKKAPHLARPEKWLRELDLNQRPLGYEPN